MAACTNRFLPHTHAMLVRFDYNNNHTPSFPEIIAALKELWISWTFRPA